MTYVRRVNYNITQLVATRITMGVIDKNNTPLRERATVRQCVEFGATFKARKVDRPVVDYFQWETEKLWIMCEVGGQ